MSSRRWFIYVPEINARTFVFFFYRGSTGRSWSVRDYTTGLPVPRRANEYSWTADGVLDMARGEGGHAVATEAHPTEDVAWYQARIQELNDEYLGGGPSMSDSGVSAPETALKPTFPMLDIGDLLSHPKSRKTQDMRRIYESPQSEDWVTWTVLHALDRIPAQEWWPGVLETVLATPSPPVRVPSPQQPPGVDLWRAVASPAEYQAASRLRMTESANLEWRARADRPEPVEGATEVDLVFDGASYLVFVEAKLNSDISERTTYDPERNQIARNIDCVIEQAGDREPFFWMFVKDRAPKRLYSQAIDTYRRNPEELQRLLPHRSLDVLREVTESIAVVTWREMYPLLPSRDDTADALAELTRRI
jgi:hypothetical protein